MPISPSAELIPLQSLSQGDRQRHILSTDLGYYSKVI